MAKDKERKATDAETTYLLGPQLDGSIVIKVQDDFDLMVLRKAIEKQEKNSGAATGTISALAEGDDPFLDRIQQSLKRLVANVARARAPENQVKDTPIGKEIATATAAALAGDTPEAVDGKDGSAWAPHVPVPRPRRLQEIQHPTGALVAIDEIEGYEPELGAFSVKAAGNLYAVVAHSTGKKAGAKIFWRLVGETYDTPRVDPATLKADTPAAAAASTPAKELEDAAKGSAEGAADVVEDTDASGEPRASKAPSKRPASKKPIPAIKAPIAGAAQRDRNARQSGLKPGPKGGKKK